MIGNVTVSIKIIINEVGIQTIRSSETRDE